MFDLHSLLEFNFEVETETKGDVEFFQEMLLKWKSSHSKCATSSSKKEISSPGLIHFKDQAAASVVVSTTKEEQSSVRWLLA